MKVVHKNKEVRQKSLLVYADWNCTTGFGAVAKELVDEWSKDKKLSIVIFGINDKGVSAKKNALQFLVNKIKINENIDLYEGGNFFRDYLDVRDAVSAIDLIINNGEPNKIYNVGSGKPTLFIDLMVKAKEVFRSSSEFTHIETPDFHRIVQVKDAYLDIADLSELGFVPKYDIMHEIINL
jgi:nucleoside-diphosphate-sugar epimerase